MNIKVAKQRKKIQKDAEALGQFLEGGEDVFIESFESPESSNIAGASYDIPKKELTVTFKGKGGSPDRKYKYAGVSIALWGNFKTAPSKGKFFAEFIVRAFVGTPA